MNASAQTADAPAAGPTKIAVIAFQTAVTQTNEFQRNFADLQKKYEPKREGLKTLTDQVDTLKKQLQSQAETLSDADRESRSLTINEKEKLLQRTQGRRPERLPAGHATDLQRRSHQGRRPSD